VLAAIAILAGSSRGLAQTRPTGSMRVDKTKDRLTEAFSKSKLITIKVKNAKDLTGSEIKGGEVKGVVKSVNDTCFRFEYQDGLRKIRQDCIPYGDVVIEQWHMRALHILKVVGLDSAFIAGGLALMPILIPVVVIAGLLGHPLDC
jgi:hypothetical protein